MWCLEGCEGLCIYIPPNCKKSFGKSRSDIKLEGDATVSRLHAIIFVESSEESETQYKCVISDLSKYGTFVLRDGEKRKLSTDEKFALTAGDKVQFGLKHSIFTVTCRTFVIARSSLNEKEMEKLRDIVKELGGRLSDGWQSSCTHLTVPERVLFTTKLACALVSAKPIVTIAYWEAIKKAVEESKKLPEIDDFLPSVKEEWLHARPELFLPKKERGTLFRGLSFVHFCTKQYFAYAPLISAAGGKSCVYPTRKPLTPRDLTAKNAIVVQQPANDSSQFTQVIAADYPIIYCKLNALKRRMVSDTEIPLAILYCSTEKYCNPKFDFGTLLKSTTQTFSPSDVVIVQDTQEDTSPVGDKRKIQNKEQQRIIPETCDQRYNIDDSKKTCPSKYESKKSGTSGIRKNGSNIIDDIFSGRSRNNKQFQIIPETSDSFEKSVASDSSPGKSNKKPSPIIPESCERNIVNELYSEREQQNANILQKNVEFQAISREEISIKEENNFSPEKDDSMFGKNNPTFEKKLIFEKDNNFFEDNNSTLTRNILAVEKDNSALEKENLTCQNDKNRGSGWKNAMGPRIVSIEKIDNGDNSEIRVERAKEKTSRKACTRIEEGFQNPRRELSLIHTLEENQKATERMEEITVNEGDKRGEIKPRRTGTKETREEERHKRKMSAEWYEKYLNCGLTDKILRKEIPRGKIFAKTPVLVPTKKLKMDDFV